MNSSSRRSFGNHADRSPSQRDWFIEPAIPEDATTVVIFGGSFDPPHTGHIELPERALPVINGDWLLYVPASRAPLKHSAPEACAADRLSMLRAALDGKPRTSVTDVEIRRGGTSYTLDTLRQLRERLRTTLTFRLLIGADQATTFHRWREPEEIIRLAAPVVLLRTPDQSGAELLERMRRHWPEDELARWQARIIELPLRTISSTQVREFLRRDGPLTAELAGMVPQPILEYIETHGLYQSAGAPHE